LRRERSRGSLPVVFGVSLTELVLIAVVTLIIVGPQKLPKMLRTLGEWIGKLRRLTTEVRAPTGIDDILRQEGIDGVHELRSILRGDLSAVGRSLPRRQFAADDPYADAIALDRTREYPPEGPDAAGTVPDDLVDDALGEQPELESLPAEPAPRAPS
jgi:sec-independent protein translocase protein TatB